MTSIRPSLEPMLCSQIVHGDVRWRPSRECWSRTRLSAFCSSATSTLGGTDRTLYRFTMLFWNRSGGTADQVLSDDSARMRNWLNGGAGTPGIAGTTSPSSRTKSLRNAGPSYSLIARPVHIIEVNTPLSMRGIWRATFLEKLSSHTTGKIAPSRSSLQTEHDTLFVEAVRDSVPNINIRKRFSKPVPNINIRN